MRFILSLILISILGWGIYFSSGGAETINTMNALLAISSNSNLNAQNVDFISGACQEGGIATCYHLLWHIEWIFITLILAVLYVLISFVFKLSASKKESKEESVNKELSESEYISQGFNVPHISQKGIVLIVLSWFVLAISFIKFGRDAPSIISIPLALLLYLHLVVFVYYLIYSDKYDKTFEQSQSSFGINEALNSSLFQKRVLLIMLPISIWLIISFS